MSNLNSAQNARGAWLMIGGMAMIGFVDNFIGPMAEVIGLWQFQIQRSIIAVPTLILLSVFGVLSVRPKFWKPVLLRSTLIAFGMMWYFGALGFIPLSQALAGLFTSPIWVLLFTALFRGIPVSRAQWFAVCLSFLGALVVLDIWGDQFSLASAMPIVAGLFWALGAIVTRDYCSQETPSAMLAALFSMQFVLAGLALIALAFLNPVVPDGSAGFIVRPLDQRLVACVVDIVVAGLGILGWGWINDPRLSSGGGINRCDFRILGLSLWQCLCPDVVWSDR